jgi:hypothetical protein
MLDPSQTDAVGYDTTDTVLMQDESEFPCRRVGLEWRSNLADEIKASHFTDETVIVIYEVFQVRDSQRHRITVASNTRSCIHEGDVSVAGMRLQLDCTGIDAGIDDGIWNEAADLIAELAEPFSGGRSRIINQGLLDDGGVNRGIELAGFGLDNDDVSVVLAEMSPMLFEQQA